MNDAPKPIDVMCSAALAAAPEGQHVIVFLVPPTDGTVECGSTLPQEALFGVLLQFMASNRGGAMDAAIATQINRDTKARQAMNAAEGQH